MATKKSYRPPICCSNDDSRFTLRPAQLRRLQEDADARKRLRRSAAGRLALVTKTVGQRDIYVHATPVRRLTETEQVEVLMAGYSRAELWDILGRIGGACTVVYRRQTKAELARRIARYVSHESSLINAKVTKAGLNAACALLKEMRAVGAFCWVLAPHTA